MTREIFYGLTSSDVATLEEFEPQRASKNARKRHVLMMNEAFPSPRESLTGLVRVSLRFRWNAERP